MACSTVVNHNAHIHFQLRVKIGRWDHGMQSLEGFQITIHTLGAKHAKSSFCKSQQVILEDLILSKHCQNVRPVPHYRYEHFDVDILKRYKQM